MASVTGAKEVQGMLSKVQEQIGVGPMPVVIVGYTVAYAIYVHENVGAKHPVGQAKFLEQPARQYAAEIVRMVEDALKKGVKFVNALLLGGLKLQRESQKLCPVDTGALRNSAFTRVQT